MNSTILVKYFTVTWPDSGTRIRVFSFDVNIQKPFYKTKIWDRVCLRNIQNFKISIKYFTVAWPDSGTRFWVIVVSVDTWKLLNQRELVFLTESFYESFKISKFQYSIKFFTATWPNAGTNNRKFLESIFPQKLL